jgi:hypothetical protein
MTVVVEVQEDVTTQDLPFAHAVRPPAEIGVRVGARIQPFTVRSVQTYVHEVSRRSEDARQVRAAHDAIRGSMFLQHREHGFVMPAHVPELKGDAQGCGHTLQELGKAHLITARTRRKLDQHRAKPRSKQAQPSSHQGQPSVRSEQSLAMRQCTWSLDAQEETIWQPTAPARER